MPKSSFEKSNFDGKRFDILHLGKCLGISYVASILMLFILALAATFWEMESGAVNICIAVINGISVTLCGFAAAKRAGRGGLLTGAAAGAFYTLILYAVGTIITGNLSFGTAVITAAAVGVICGGIGGVIGVNRKGRRR